MNPKPIEQSGSELLIHGLTALKRAAIRAREVARATNTYIVIQKNGKIVRLYPGDKGFDYVDPDQPLEKSGSDA